MSRASALAEVLTARTSHGLTIVAATTLLAACRSHAVSTSPAPPHAIVVDAARPSRPAALRVRDLLERRTELLGRHVVVDLYERLDDETERSWVGPGALEVDLLAGPETLRLVPSSSGNAAFVEAGRRRSEGPMRIEGVFREGDVDALPRGFVIAVERIESLDLPEPVDIGACESITHADAGVWDGRFVRCEGMWHQRMEVSSLDGTWMEVARYAETVNRPDAAREPGGMSYPVRVTGLVDARPGGRYGHMGRSHALILATRIEYTGRPLSVMELWRERLRHDAGLLQQLGAPRSP